MVDTLFVNRFKQKVLLFVYAYMDGWVDSWTDGWLHGWIPSSICFLGHGWDINGQEFENATPEPPSLLAALPLSSDVDRFNQRGLSLASS